MQEQVCQCECAGMCRIRNVVVSPGAHWMCQQSFAKADKIINKVIDERSQEEWQISQPSRGAGDTIAKAIHAVTGGKLKSCGGCKNRQAALNRVFPFTFRGDQTPPFISSAQLMEDAKALASKLPAETSRIVGVSRSGLCVATMVSMLLHRPLSILRQSMRDVIPAGNGWRLSGNTGRDDGPVVVIDDTVMTGNSFRDVLPIVRAVHPNAMTAAVYVNPAAHTKPDIWVKDLPWPHLLEWNLFNSILSPHMACDCDGILCHDCPPGDDDDGVRYAGFLANARPLYIARRVPIPLVVTARLEKYRPHTEDWLRRHGIEVRQLVMGPWANNAERARADIAAYKAQKFSEFLKQRHSIKPPMFIESCPHQAQRIAQLARGVVVCPAARRCFS